MSKISTDSYKGVRDFYPEDQAFLMRIFSIVRDVVERVGYVEYNASILEPAELYRAKGAENEEMVNEQTYTFTDRGGREVTLRPEMTPTVARMVSARRRELGFPLRWYSIPNCFRYERPQRGRLREFWQVNVDLFGSRSIAADIEILELAYKLMKAFGASDDDFTIRIGSRTHIDRLSAEAGLSEGGRRSLLALLDRKAKMPQEEFLNGLTELGISPDTLDPAETPEDIAKVLQYFRAKDIENVIYDPSIVRGFAYYTGIVFEVFDTSPENNRALMGGGRYDNLTELFDDEHVPGVGFALGDETIRLFMESRGLIPEYTPPTRVYIAVSSADLAPEAEALADELRASNITVAIDFGERKLGDQIKAATKHRIPYLIVVGPDEVASGQYTVRTLATGEEAVYPRTALASFFNS